MNAIETELGLGEESNIIENPTNVEFIPHRETGKFFAGGMYHDNMDDLERYKHLIRRDKD